MRVHNNGCPPFPNGGRSHDNGKWAGKHICTRCDAKNRARILTPVQAYKVAINALNTFERKWDVYVKEQARLLSVFDEDEE